MLWALFLPSIFPPPLVRDRGRASFQHCHLPHKQHTFEWGEGVCEHPMGESYGATVSFSRKPIFSLTNSPLEVPQQGWLWG